MGFLRDRARERSVFDAELLEAFTAQWAVAAPVADRRTGALQECLERLPGRARELVRLRYFDELSAEEIARRTGANGASLRVMLQRVREQLRECIERRMQAEGGAA
jgi:RNA polymerase sigma-70 factor (ECF subfamily)